MGPASSPRSRLGRGVQLIVYPNRFGATLAGLQRLLDGPILRDVFTGVHLLPFYVPFDGADGGFDPIDHTQVDPRLGDWDDVRALADRYSLVADVIVNHMSSAAPQFLDVMERGDDAEHPGMFLMMGDVFTRGATEEDLLRIFRPRPGPPFTVVPWGARRRLAWTTFTADQIDLDHSDPETQAYLERVLQALARAGVRMVRLDAAGYAVKTAGTTCFLTPATFEFIRRLTGRAHELGMEVLVEAHTHYAKQVALASTADWVYDFALPPLVLYSLYTGDGDPLRRWLGVRPSNSVTVLDTHDGIGVMDIGPSQLDGHQPGLLAVEQIDRIVEGIHEHTDQESRASTGAGASNVDAYQVNTTYYEAVGRDDQRYLLARALQFFIPGLPQVYYVGLLAGHNDLALLAQTGVGRDINRRKFLTSDLEEHLARPVVAALFELIRFRNAHPAFDGEFSHAGAPGVIQMTWAHGGHRATLTANLMAGRASVAWTDAQGRQRHTPDLLEPDWHSAGGTSA
ncbi:sucrose phosphorylase [Cellulomonas timonensis]|uniref:sucrose phosphorylase n=1 Tax=Cellulomonas timonensis TaxID=1689271 RepID=UPI00082B7FD3|nr:sucrose phosphorylase [Cellulomonas timonensis]